MRNRAIITVLGVFVLGVASFLPVSAGQIDVQLQIPIPTGAGTTQKEITVCEPVGGLFKCEGIAAYITTIYRWLIGIAAVLAVLAITWGGVLWLTSMGEQGRVQEARKIMGNAIIGLVLALGSYLLLAAINPKLVQYDSLAVKPIRKIELEIDPPESLTRVTNPTGTCCSSAQASEVIALIDKNGVNDAAGFKTNLSRMNPKIFAGAKMVLEQCPEGGLAITSTVRPKDKDSWHKYGGAIDFSGTICGVAPAKLCDNEKTKNLIRSLMAAGYEVGTYQGTCSSFIDKGTGPHLHIELPGSPRP